MGIISKVQSWFGEKRAITYSSGLQGGLLATPTYSGMAVTEATALGLSPIWCAVRVISEALGSLPLNLYQRSSTGKTQNDTHPLARIFDSEPNAECTWPVLKETAQAHALLYGNAFLEIERDGAGRPLALWNVHPNFVTIGRDSDTGKLIYRIQHQITGGPPGLPGEVQTLLADDVIHVPGLSPDGSVGYRLLLTARNSIAFGLAAQRYGCSLFRNLGRPGGAFKVPPTVKLNEDGRENIKRSFREDTTGENVGSVLLLEQGNDFTPFTLATNEQTQYKELLTFFVEETSRLFNISPTKLYSLGRATWANLETLNTDFLTGTLRPWLEKWEHELEKKCLMPGERGRYCIEFDTTQLLRVDQAARYQSYAVASGNTPWLTVNEIRAREGLSPLDGGDELPDTTPAPTQAPTSVPEAPKEDDEN